MNPTAKAFVPSWAADEEDYVDPPKPVAAAKPAAAPKPAAAAAAPAAKAAKPVAAAAPAKKVAAAPAPAKAAAPAKVAAPVAPAAPIDVKESKEDEPVVSRAEEEDEDYEGDPSFVPDEEELKAELEAIQREEAAFAGIPIAAGGVGGAEVAGEMDGREHLNLVFIGHVDAGKSTISGRILLMMGMVDSRLIEKYEREAKEKNRDSWYIAYILDVSEEERAKGKTFETARAYFTTEKKRYTILDAPGHKSFVPSMISGASQADVAVLVISARKGEFETGFERGGQTREHAMLVKTLGVSKLVIAVNKMDDPSVGWSEERFTTIQEKLNPFLKSCGFNVKKQVEYVPIAGLPGLNIKDRVSSSVCSWYKGSSLIEVLDALPPVSRDPDGPVRMPLVDRYKHKSTTVCFGKLETGTLKVGMPVMVMPTRLPAEVAGIEINDKPYTSARPGENLCVYLKGVEESQVLPGFVICSASDPCPSVKTFVAQVAVLELLEKKPLMTKGYLAVMHIHSAQLECEVTDIIALYDKKTGKPDPKNKYPPFIKSGAMAAVRITLEESTCVETFDIRPQLGRFTLRDEGKTIAIGKVLKIEGVPSAKASSKK